MAAFFRKFVLALGLVLAAPFWSFGVVGLVKHFKLDDVIREYVGLTMYDNPVKCLVSLLVGSLIFYGLKALADRVR